MARWSATASRSLLRCITLDEQYPRRRSPVDFTLFVLALLIVLTVVGIAWSLRR